MIECPPEDMTVKILKHVLDEYGVKYKSNARKAELVHLVTEKKTKSNIVNIVNETCSPWGNYFFY